MLQKSKKFFLYKTTGGSMFPFIIWDEYIVVKKIEPRKLKINDVILFDGGYIKVCHRLKKIFFKNKQIFFQTKGDHNKFFDRPIKERQILGKVIAIKKKARLIKTSGKVENWCYNKFIFFKFGVDKFLKQLKLR